MPLEHQSLEGGAVPACQGDPARQVGKRSVAQGLTRSTEYKHHSPLKDSVYTHIYIYMSMSVWLSIYIYIYICLSLSLSTLEVYTYIYIYIYMHTYTRVSVCFYSVHIQKNQHACLRTWVQQLGIMRGGTNRPPAHACACLCLLPVSLKITHKLRRPVRSLLRLYRR